MNCPNCGNLVSPSIPMCPHCKGSLVRSPGPKPYPPTSAAPPTSPAPASGWPTFPAAVSGGYPSTRTADPTMRVPIATATPPTTVLPATPSAYPGPGLPGTPAPMPPAATGGMFRRLRTGVNGSTAFAATILGAQAWGGIGWGIVIMAFGGLTRSLNDDVYSNDGCSYGYCDDTHSTVHNATNIITIAGIVTLIAGLGLFIGMISLLMGRRAGRGIVITFECLFTIGIVLTALSSKTAYPLVAAIVPVTVIICLINSDTNRMYADSDLNYASPNP